MELFGIKYGTGQLFERASYGRIAWDYTAWNESKVEKYASITEGMVPDVLDANYQYRDTMIRKSRIVPILRWMLSYRPH